MRQPAQSILVEFFTSDKEFIVGLDLFQAPAVGETVKFARVGGGYHYVVTKVEWFVGLIDESGRKIEPGSDGRAFQTAIVEVRPP